MYVCSGATEMSIDYSYDQNAITSQTFISQTPTGIYETGRQTLSLNLLTYHQYAEYEWMI